MALISMMRLPHWVPVSACKRDLQVRVFVCFLMKVHMFLTPSWIETYKLCMCSVDAIMRTLVSCFPVLLAELVWEWLLFCLPVLQVAWCMWASLAPSILHDVCEATSIDKARRELSQSLGLQSDHCMWFKLLEEPLVELTVKTAEHSRYWCFIPSIEFHFTMYP